MKKILIILFLIITLILPIWVYSAWCNIWADDIVNIWDSLDDCLRGSPLVSWIDGSIETWLSAKINSWVKNIWMVLWILAVWSIVYGSLLMTLSAWEDEKIKKAKDVIKWWIIGFIWLISASGIILLVVNIMYSLEV